MKRFFRVLACALFVLSIQSATSQQTQTAPAITPPSVVHYQAPAAKPATP